MKREYHAGGALRATRRQQAHATQGQSRYMPISGMDLTSGALLAAGISAGLYGIYKNSQGKSAPKTAPGHAALVDARGAAPPTPPANLTQQKPQVHIENTPLIGSEWFETLFEFLDTNGDINDNKKRFLYNRGTGVLQLSGDGTRKWQAGIFTTPSLGELRNKTEKIPEKNAGGPKTTVRFVPGDVHILHGDAEYAGAVFQSASQFNCLEFGDQNQTPEDGVAIYAYDPTQGPACAIACAPGTIVRNYFAFDDGKEPQTKDKQINTLDEVNKYLSEGNNTGKLLVAVKNGYTDIATSRGNKGLGSLNGAIKEKDRDYAMSLLKVGVQKETEVTFTKRETAARNGAPWYRVTSDPPLLVTQVYASALAIGYTKGFHKIMRGREWHELTDGEKKTVNVLESLWEPLAQIVLDAAYEATLHAAVLYAKAGTDGRKRVVLTALGGGAFRNNPAWISSAIVKAIAKFKGSGLDVVINEWEEGALAYVKKALEANPETSGLLEVLDGNAYGRARHSARSARAISLYTA